MRNDLQDEVTSIPSLTIDECDSLGEEFGKQQRVVPKGKRSWGYVLWLLFVLYSVGMFGLFWFYKQEVDSIQRQLEERVSSTSMLSQATTDQFNKQQAVVSSSLESLGVQNKQLVSKLAGLAATQQKIITKQEAQEKRLNQLAEELASVTKVVKANDKAMQVAELVNEVNALKKLQLPASSIKSLTADVQALQKQNLAPVVKGLQDDLLLLRSQLDAHPSNSGQSIEALQKQLQVVQDKLQKMQAQLDSRSPY